MCGFEPEYKNYQVLLNLSQAVKKKKPITTHQNDPLKAGLTRIDYGTYFLI